MKVLITGIAGFVGSHLARRLVAEGFEVHGIVRRTTNLDAIEGCKDIKLHVFDGNQESLDDAFASSPDIVVHLAAVFVSEHSSTDIPRLVDSNILFGTMLLDSMRRSGCRRIVNTGTVWQHFGTDSYRAVNLYAATKQAFEDILAYYADAESLSYINLMLCDTYGDDDKRGKLYSALKKKAADGSKIELSPGDQYVDFVHVDKVVEGFERAILILMNSIPPIRRVYRVTSGEVITLKELVERWQELWGIRVNAVWGGRSYRKREVMRPWAGAEDILAVDPKDNTDR